MDDTTEPALHDAFATASYHASDALSVDDKAAFACHMIRYGRTRQAMWPKALGLLREHGIPLKETLELDESALASLMAQPN